VKTIRELKPGAACNEVLLTFDVDWAPDEVVTYCIELLRSHGARATFFATHNSPLLQDLSVSSDIEIGIHPNYFHCTEFARLVDGLLAWYPNATSIRGHGLYTSSNIQAMYEAKGLTHCVDTILPYHPQLQPVYLFATGGLISVPYFWEDGHVLHHVAQPKYRLDLAAYPPGLKIFNFHPIHVFCNTPNYQFYEQHIRPVYKDVNALRNLRQELGAETMLRSILGGSRNNH